MQALSLLPDPVLESVTRRALALATRTGVRRIPVYLAEGTLPSGAPGSVLVAGHLPGAKYLPERFFDARPTYRRLGSFPAWRLPSVLAHRRAEADLTVLRLDRRSASRWVGLPPFSELDDWVLVPEWIGTRIPVPHDLEPLLRSGGSIRRDMTLVRRHGYEATTTASAKDLRTFYSEFYRAFTIERHGESGFLRSESDLRRRLRRGEILFVESQGDRVAGGFYERVGDDLVLLALGTRRGDLEPVRHGALAALYYFVLRRAQETGCRSVDLRGCRPSLADGVLRFKTKWGAELCEKAETYYDLLVHWPRPSRAVRDFLTRCPLVFRDGGGFSALTAGARAEQLWVPGLRQLHCLSERGRDVVRSQADGHPHVSTGERGARTAGSL